MFLGKPSHSLSYYLRSPQFRIDYSSLHIISTPIPRRLALLLLASSHVIHTFQVRPFSNSLESVLVALCLVFLQSVL
ncbi:glycosyltransferase family 22 protein, partial [Hydnomerulius pinastri MD-312]